MDSPTYDLVVRGGTIITEDASWPADVGIRGDKVAAISPNPLAGHRIIDATDRLVMPGGVDPHTHLNSVWPFPDERRPADAFAEGTRGAAAGGVTTVCDFVYPLDDESLAEAIDRVAADAASAHVDVALHVAITTLRDDFIDEVASVVDTRLPVVQVLHLAPRLPAKGPEYLRLLSRIGEAGGIAMFHCEDRAIVEYSRGQLLHAGKTSPRFYPASKPVEAEIAATTNAVCIAAVAGVPSYVVHLSAGAALDAALGARSRGATVFVETRPLYLYLTGNRYDAEDNMAARFIGTPPLRSAEDVARMWDALAAGEVDTIGSDHVGFTVAQKYQTGDTFDTVPKGVASVESMLPMLYSVGVREGRISVNRLVQVTATNPARIFGLYPRKGTIAVGSDADIYVFDPHKRRELTGRTLHSAADLELFEGTTVLGWPTHTISRGRVVYENGDVVGRPGDGTVVVAGPTAISKSVAGSGRRP